MSYDELREWLTGFVAGVLEIEPREVDPTATWEALGVDSATILVLVADLSVELGTDVKPVQVLDHPTIDDLSAHLTAVLVS